MHLGSDNGPPVLAPGVVRHRHLLAQERWLGAWQLRRWRASRKWGPRIRSTELKYGSEYLRLFAAYRADYISMLVICLVSVLAGAFVNAFSMSLALTIWLTVGGLGLIVGIISLVRLWQSSIARSEYERAKQSMPSE